VAVSFRILGPLEVQDDGMDLPLGTGRQRALLGLLLVQDNGLVSSGRLIEELWAGQPPATAQKALHGYVSQLRRALGHGVIVTRGSGYRLAAADTDAKQFERLTKLAAEQDAKEAVATLERALGLWRGRAFEEFEDEEWAWLEIARLEELRLTAIEQRIGAELELGHDAELVPELEKRVAEYPSREQLRAQLMVALYRSGRQTDALEVYRRGRQVLHDELGLEPSPSLAELERQILRHDDTLTAPTRRVRTADNEEKPGRQRRLLAAVVMASVIVALAAVAVGIIVAGRTDHDLLPNSLIRIDPTTLKATQVAQVGDAPDLVIASGGYLWVTNHIQRDSTATGIRNAGDRTLIRVDPMTEKAVVVGGGLAPCGLTADPSGDVWVINCYTNGQDTAVRIDAKKLTFKATWSIPGGPGFFRGRAYGAGSLWISGGGGGDRSLLTQLDPESGGQRTTDLGRYAGAMAWSGGSGDLWVANFDDGTMMRVNPTTQAAKTINSGATNPDSPAINADSVWIGDWSNPQVVRLPDVGSDAARSIRLPMQHAGCPKLSCVWNVAAGAGAIWATTPEDDALWRINPSTNAVTRISLPYAPTGVTADANNVWVTVRE
jgi:DNA-binding SARP family transcriptional activator/streptogramin lyase